MTCYNLSIGKLTCNVMFEVLQHGIPIGAGVVDLRLFAAVVLGKRAGIDVLVQGRHFTTVEKQLKNQRKKKK